MGVENGGGSPESERQIKVQVVAEGLKKANFLRPNEEEKDKLDDRISEAFGYLKHGVESVAEIDGTIADFETKGDKSSFTETQIENLRADREILADAVTIACRDLTATDPDLESEFFLGPKHIDGLLGEKLTGLGNSVSERKGIPKEIGAELDKLEMMRRKMKGGNTAESKAYVAILKKKIDAIAEKDFDGQFEVLMVLNGELEKYEGVSDSERKMAEAAEKMSRAAEEMNKGEKKRIDSSLDGPERVEFVPDEPIGFDGDEGVSIGGKERRGFSYGPELPEFAQAVIESRNTDYRESSPPLWLKEKNKDETYWYRMADYMSGCAATKTALKDSVKGLEKLWFDDNIRLKLNESDFKIMYERKGFRFATETILRDICVLKKDTNNGDVGEFLYIKKDAKGNPATEVLECIYDLDGYKEKIAMLVCKIKAYGDTDFEASFRSEINKLMSNNKLDEEQAIVLWKQKHNFLDAQIEAGTAWNFLYNCNFLESADFDRDLVPTDAARGDTVHFVFHPESKVNSKLKESKITSGREEIKGGPLADWFAYQLEHNPQFRREYDQGSHRLFPKRLCVSFLDTYPVRTVDGEKMTMAQALFKGKTIDCSKFRFYDESGVAQAATKLSMFKDYKDSLEGALTTFKYLTGEVPLDGKNTQQWAIGIKNGMALLRQQEKNISGKRMPEIDSPEIYAAIIYASFGVDRTDNLLTVKRIFPDYKAGLQMVTLLDFIKSSNPVENVSKGEWSHTPFQKRVFDFVYKNAWRRVVNEFRK